MPFFQNILVGIDLTRCPRLDVDCLGGVSETVLSQARWLARHNGGRVTFLAALNETDQPWHLIDPEQHARLTRAVEEAASALLLQLAERERQAGVDAHVLLAPGKGWVELTSQVVRGGHDLVLIGSRQDTGLRRALFGSTGLRLLRNCPCPVWIVRPGPAEGPRRILVPTDLQPTSGVALELAMALTHLTKGGHLHVLHVLDYPLDHLWSNTFSDEWTLAYHSQVHDKAADAIRDQLERAGTASPDTSVQVHLVEGAGIPDEAILEFIQQWGIDLAVMGTVARSGVWGALLGNAAERLLPELRCSIVAVKPPDFHCPVHPD